MRKILTKVFICFCAMLIMFQVSVPISAAVNNSSQFRAFWVSSAFNMDFPSKNNLTPAEMRAETDRILDRAVELNFNAVVVQVRPSGDALYRSDIYPWSAMLTGTQGQAPAEGFDPFAYWVERAHARNLKIHAWINPYRVTYPAAAVPDLNTLSPGNPARLNPSSVVEYKSSDGRVGHYYDPGLPENRQLVVNGVAEIIDRYMVDGIHLDDYFYPGTDFPDDNSYNIYGGGMNRDDWRRENVNTLIRLLQQTVRDKAPDISFGISPTAIWQNKSSTELGSDTRGFESYKSAYADTRRWVKEGWLDYICPQIYWYIGFDIADYAKVLAWWEDVCRGTGVDLYIGHAAYRLADGEANWTAGEMARQLELNAKNGVVKGDIFFRAGSLFGAVGDEIKRYYATAPAGTITPTPPPAVVSQPAAVSSIIMDTLSVAQPSGNVSVTSGSGYQVFGTCVPGRDVFVNGQPVANRTVEGFFSVYVPLVKGENVFTFTQDGREPVTRIITLKDAAVSRPAVMETLGVTNAYPGMWEVGRPGDVITLKCTAPAGAAVTVTLPDVQPSPVTIPLTQTDSGIVNDGSIYAAAYSGTYTLPGVSSSDESISLGNPIYTANFNGQVYTLTAGGHIGVQGPDLPFFATVNKELIWAYPKASETGGSSWSLAEGQMDRITAITGSGAWTRLASGGWVRSEDVTAATDSSLNPPAPNILSVGQYVQGADEDIVSWRSPYFIASTMDFDGSALTVRFGMQKDAPSHTINTGSTIFESVTAGVDNGAPCYVFTLRQGENLEGYYMDYANGEVRLHIKKRKALSVGAQPLAGFNIVLDAGHGDHDSGAIGPMGAAMPEKSLNLTNTQKIAMRLRQMGANVVLTRDTDIFYELYERTEISRRNLPDLFISVHANALDETTDTSNVRGLTLWYRNENSKPAADSFIQTLHSVNPLTNRGMESHQSNFFVCRPTWAPSLIIETSFMGNVEDFSWLVNPARQDELAWGVVNAVLAYYR